MRTNILLLIGLLGVSGGTPALAMSVPNQDHLSSALHYPGAPKIVYDDHPAPYAMNYADEAARNLGIKDGRMDVFSTHPDSSSFLPSVSGGVGADGAMLRLKWHPGE